MDGNERLVWIDSDPAVDPSRAGALCRRHADALRPPMGWTLDDRRDEVPRLLRIPENGTIAPAGRAGTRAQHSRSRRETEAPVADLFSDPPPVDAEADAVSDVVPDAASEVPPVEPASDVPSTDGAGLDETRAIPWVPRLGGGVSDDVPRGRLLGRAFGRREQGDERTGTDR